MADEDDDDDEEESCCRSGLPVPIMLYIEAVQLELWHCSWQELDMTLMIIFPPISEQLKHIEPTQANEKRRQNEQSLKHLFTTQNFQKVKIFSAMPI